jgi:putative endonuclease
VVDGAALEKRSPIISERGFESHPLRGEVLEWSIRHAWRACVGVSSTVGSNPTLSASLRQGYGWQARFTMWYVYILKSAIDNKLYVGSTNDIARRLTEHNSGKVGSTKNRTPLRLEAYFAVKDKSRAIALEQYFKTGSGRAFLQKRIL